MLVMVAVLVQLGGPHVKVNEQTLGLVTEDKRFARDLIGAIRARSGRSRWRGRSGTCGDARVAREPNVKPTFIGMLAIAGGVSPP